MAFSLTITVSDPADTFKVFDRIKVYRSDTTDQHGPYTEITTPSTRIPLTATGTSYSFIDDTAPVGVFYRSSFFNSLSQLESSLSEPAPGNQAASSVLSVQQLRNRYLFGIDLTDDAGNPIPDEAFEFYIESAIDRMETTLDIPIIPRTIVDEKHDYYREDYDKYIWLETEQFPIQTIQAIRLVLPGGQVVQDFPEEWYQVKEEFGQIQLVPGTGTAGTILLGANGAYIPIIYGNAKFIPNAFRIDYTAGFNKIPSEIVDLIGKVASFGPLNIAGDLLGGAGIASQSLSLDGLSQSFATTSSATNAGYGARLTQYEKEIKEALPRLQRYYKGLRMKVL